MVKQDAMNVFLGFYVPNEISVPLWDLDSDYYLHNRISKPPTPYMNRILYEENRLNTTSTGSSRRESFVADSRCGGGDGGGERRKDRPVHDEEMSKKQELMVKRYFMNNKKGHGLVQGGHKGVLLKSDYPFLFHNEDHEPPISPTCEESEPVIISTMKGGKWRVRHTLPKFLRKE